MNKERMLKLADEIEKPTLPVGFNMSEFYSGSAFITVGDLPECGTCCCIGGIACLMFGEKGDTIDSYTATQLLDLPEEQAGKLFFNYDHYIVDDDTRFSEITRQEAAMAIRRMVQEEK